MRTAKLGDDARRAQSTVRCLEELAANKIGKEVVILIATATIGNLIAMKGHI